MNEHHQVNVRELQAQTIEFKQWCEGPAKDGKRKRLSLHIIFAENEMAAVVYIVTHDDVVVYFRSGVPLEQAVEVYNSL